MEKNCCKSSALRLSSKLPATSLREEWVIVNLPIPQARIYFTFSTKVLIKLNNLSIKYRGGSRIFFRRGCTRLLLHFNTNKPHSFFCRIPVVLENRRSSQGGRGGANPLHPPPRSAPEIHTNKLICNKTALSTYQLSPSTNHCDFRK